MDRIELVRHMAHRLLDAPASRDLRQEWPEWVAPTIGVVLYLLFRSMMALGANLQRFSMRRELTFENPRPKQKQPYLVLGVVLFTGSGVMLSIPLIFAPQSLLSPIGVSIFVANAAFAHCLNGERFSCASDGLYLGGVTAGVITCVITAPKETSGLTVDQMIALCAEPLFIGFMVTLVCVIFFLVVVRPSLIKGVQVAPVDLRAEVGGAGNINSGCGDGSGGRSDIGESSLGPASNSSTPERPTDSLQAALHSVGASDSDAIANGSTSNGIAAAANSAVHGTAAASTRAHVALAGCVGSLAGCLGGLNITVTKSIFSLIEGTWVKSGFVAVLISPGTWVIGIGLLCTYVAQIRMTTDGLERCPAMIFVPVQTVTEETVATLGGLIYFREFTQFTTTTAIAFFCGISLSVMSVISLTAVRIKRSSDEVGTVRAYATLDSDGSVQHLPPI